MASPSAASPLEIGQEFGRYHIIRLLGMGGMGAVYQAWDSELEVAVALKVIRPEVTANRVVAQEIERRFKRELLLARQVTHKNVVRIHDLGEIGGIKYITMSYIEGLDLATTLKRQGKMPAAAALGIVRGIVSGLRAAHEAGVVHRDLKPANIMIETRSGEPLIMDFGIARSAGDAAEQGRGEAVSKRLGPSALAGATRAGAVVGTVAYMAPEQAKGQAVDQRADVYALGLIFYDMLTGLRRSEGASSEIAELQERMQQAPPSVRSVDPEIPDSLDRLIDRCLEPGPEGRYQTTAELAADLDALDAEGRPLPRVRRLTTRLMSAAGLVVAALVAATWWLARSPAPPVTPPPVSVLVADFENRTNDPVFNGLLENPLNIAIEGASFISAYPRPDAQKLAVGIKPGSRLDEEMVRLISIREGVRVILAGSIEPSRRGYTLSVRIIDQSAKEEPKMVTASVSDKANVLEAVASVGSQIRTALGDTTPEQAQRAMAETFTASSLEAVRSYTLAQDALAAEQYEGAIAHYRRAIELDPKFGRAYSGWALSAENLGRKEEAAELWKKALALLDRMTEREKFRTLGLYYSRVARNYDKAIESYTNLVNLFPGDGTGYNNLAVAYFRMLNFSKAFEAGRHALEIYPKKLLYRTNYALYAMYAGDFASAATEAARVIRDAPGQTYAYLPLAIAALANSKIEEARAAYEQMGRSGDLGASLSNMGLADMAMYEGRWAQAGTTLRDGIAGDGQRKNTELVAVKLAALAQVYQAQGGNTRLALDATQRALKLSRDETVVVPVSSVLVRAGREAEAKTLADALQNQLQPQRRAYANIIYGDIALKQARHVDAVEAFRSAQKLADIWLARFSLGVAYVEAGAYPEALSELEACQKRQGEAAALFLDDVPSFRHLAPLPYWLARAQEGVGLTPRAAENYKRFLSLRPESPKDPLVLDARRRLGAI